MNSSTRFLILLAVLAVLISRSGNIYLAFHAELRKSARKVPHEARINNLPVGETHRRVKTSYSPQHLEF